MGRVRVWTYAAIAVTGILAMSLWTFWLAVRPPRIVISDTPTAHRLPFEDATVVAPDGVKLAAWLIPRARSATAGRPPERPGGPDDRALILLHGYPAEKADLLPIATAFHPDFTMLLVDLRYFGRSEGWATTLGHRERLDLARAVDALAARGFTRIGVFGYSLGGAVAILGAAEDARIRAVAAYAPFSDLAVLAGEVYGVFWVAKHPLVALMRVWSRVFLGADITRPSPATAAARLAIPLMLVHSRDDEQIPFAHAERLAAALRNNPRAEFLFGRGLHNDRAPDLERRLVEFFRAHLG
jgi:dipeptidyl aminopeptidase/acylaminoacyl peptidase